MYGLDCYDFMARMMDPTGRPGFLGLDPLCEMTYSISPYAYCLNNPVKYVDPSGMLASTHTDASGNVVDVFDDGDLGVYKHKGDGEATKKELDKKYSSQNTSAGGKKMGDTFVWNSFMDAGTSLPKGKISFTTMTAKTKILIALNDISRYKNRFYRLCYYAMNAGNGEKFDLKSTESDPYIGSMYDVGYFVSIRDAGNILAGMVARGSDVPAKATYAFFGAFELSENSRMRLLTNIFKAVELGEVGYYGEKPVSHAFQKMGYELNFKWL